MTLEMLTRQMDPTGALGQALGRVGVASSKRGPGFTRTPYQEQLEAAHGLLRAGFELRLEAELGRKLTPAELDHCVTLAAAAFRHSDPDCYEDDKSEAVGQVVAYFRGRSIDASEDAIREIAQEAVSIFRAVEARS